MLDFNIIELVIAPAIGSAQKCRINTPVKIHPIKMLRSIIFLLEAFFSILHLNEMLLTSIFVSWLVFFSDLYFSKKVSGKMNKVSNIKVNQANTLK